jgi:hypothetical protein
MKNAVVQRPKPHNFKDLTGLILGRLTVLEHAGSEIVETTPKVKYKAVWLVQCTCGTKKIVRGADLCPGRTVSCGCLSKEKTAEFNTRTKTKVSYDTFSVVWQSYKRGAKVRNLPFELSKTEFYQLTQLPCHYCGSPPSQNRKARVKGKLSPFTYSGIDRVNSKLGYCVANCVPCCSVCNRMKVDTPYDEFKAKILQITNHLHLK